MSGEKVTGSRQQTAWKSKTALMLLLSLIATVMFSMGAFAADAVPSPDGGRDNGSGGGNNGQLTQRDWGWRDICQGYRMYFEDENGSVCQSAIDILWSDPNNLYTEGLLTTLNSGSAEIRIPFSAVQAYLPGLNPPVYNGQPWGQELDAWFENNDGAVSSAQAGGGDHVIDVLYIFKNYTGDNVSELYKNYHDDKARLVVESVYWISPVGRGGRYLTNGIQIYSQDASQAGYYYGTVKELADVIGGQAYKFSEKNWWTIDENDPPEVDFDDPETPAYANYGGNYTGQLTNYTFVTALFTPYKDEFSGFTLPEHIYDSNSTITGLYTYSEIQQWQAGYGMHIIRCDNAKEQWYTYKTPSGLSGGSPGAAPQMPNPLGLTDEARPITIVKYYEYRTTENGKPSYKKAAGPFTRKQVCRIISVQDELDAGWSLDSYFVSNYQGTPQTWDKFKATSKKWPKGSSPKTITVPDRYDTLYVRLIQDKEPENPEPEDEGDAVEMILYESEISKAFVSNKIKKNTMDDANKPEIKINWTIPDDYSGECYNDEHDVPDIDPKTGKATGTTHKEGGSHPHSTGQFNDKSLQFNLKFKEDELNSYGKIIATKNDPFKYKLIKNGSEELDISDVTSASEDDSKFKDFGLKYVIWRGEDQPTVQNYATQLSNGGGDKIKQTAADSSKISKLLETTAQNQDQGKRKDSQDVEVKDRYYGGDKDSSHHLKMTFYVDPDNGDFTLQKTCDTDRHCSDHVTTVDVSNLKYNFDGNVTVFYYNDEETPVADQDKMPPLSNPSGGTPAFIKDYDTAEFYPYVQMSYQTTNEISDTGVNSNGGGVVYVLSSYKRYVKAGATLRLQWFRQNYSGTSYNMLVKSDQWSTHATALDKYGKNIVLPGGAIFMLTTNGSGSGALGGYLEIEAWYPDTIPEYQSGMVHYDSKWTGTNGADEFNALVDGAVNALSNNEVVMRVAAGQSSDAQHGTIVKPGTSLAGLSAKGVKASSDTKYYLTGDAQAANSKYNTAAGGITINEDIDIIAKPDGQVKVGSQTLKKNQGKDSIQTTSNEGRAEKATGLIQSVLQALSRNKGNDKMTTFGSYWAKDDGAWYNESFGFRINHYKAVIYVGIPNNITVRGTSGVQAVLDPNLCPTSTGTKDKFSKVNTAQFYVYLKNSQIGTFNGQTISIPTDQLMSQQPFYIPNTTVQDND